MVGREVILQTPVHTSRSHITPQSSQFLEPKTENIPPEVLVASGKYRKWQMQLALSPYSWKMYVAVKKGLLILRNHAVRDG